MDLDYNIDGYGEEIIPQMPVTIDELPEPDPDHNIIPHKQDTGDSLEGDT